MPELVCVVDLGSTSIKAALVDSELRIAAMIQRPTPPLHADGVSFDAELMVDEALAALRHLADTG